MQKKEKSIMNVNLAYYRKKDWKKFIKMIDDRDGMHDSWEEWHKSYLKTKEHLSLYGMIVKEVIVDLEQLKKYCSDKNLKIDGKARSKFVSDFR